LNPSTSSFRQLDSDKETNACSIDLVRSACRGENDKSDKPEKDGLTRGMLVVNADDFGRDHLTTEKILDCCTAGTVSSVSAMVFMEDSERAAGLGRERKIEVGLHLNFTTPFSASGCCSRLLDHQNRLSRYLLRHRFAPLIFHPGLVRSFDYVFEAQMEEFHKLYGTAPAKIDGHHHMHLCANVRWQRQIPSGILVRRNFSFERGEKSLSNRLYRKRVDRSLARRYQLVDFFFSLPPLVPAGRLRRIYSLAKQFVVELETHPVNSEEYQYLTGSEILSQTREIRIAPPSAVPHRKRVASGDYQ